MFINGEDQPSKIRILYLLNEIQPCNIFINNKSVLTDATYKSLSGYIDIYSEKCEVEIFDTSSRKLIYRHYQFVEKDVNHHTFVLVQINSDISIYSIPHEPSVPMSESKVRFCHLCETAPTLDVAVKKGDVVFRDVQYLSTTHYLGLTPMYVDLEARISSTKNIVLPFPRLHFKEDKAYSIAIISSMKVGTSFEVILIED